MDSQGETLQRVSHLEANAFIGESGQQSRMLYKGR